MKTKTKEMLTTTTAVLIMYTMVLCILFGLIKGVKSFYRGWTGEAVVQSSPMDVLVERDMYRLDEKTKKLVRAKLLDKKDYVLVAHIKVITSEPSSKEQDAARVALFRAKGIGADNVLLINVSYGTRTKTQGIGVGSAVGGYSKSRTKLVRTYIYTFVALKKR